MSVHAGEKEVSGRFKPQPLAGTLCWYSQLSGSAGRLQPAGHLTGSKKVTLAGAQAGSGRGKRTLAWRDGLRRLFVFVLEGWTRPAHQ